MKIAIVAGSHRHNSQSDKVAGYCAKVSATLGAEPTVLSLAGNPLPLWSEEAWQENSELAKTFLPYSQTLAEADAVVLITPEWGGMATPAIKNFLLLCNKNELAHKPGLIVGVSSGRGGSYPIAELRMSGYKNNHICLIPENLIISKVEAVLNEGDAATKDDQYIRDRLTHALTSLVTYARVLQPVRQSLVEGLAEYPYGM